MWETLIATQDLGRLQALASILIRHGFGDLVNRLGLARALTRVGRILRISGKITGQARMITMIT